MSKRTLSKRNIVKTKKDKQIKKQPDKGRREIIKELVATDWLIVNKWKIKYSGDSDYTISLTCRICKHVDVFNIDLELAKKFYDKYIKESYKCLICE